MNNFSHDDYLDRSNDLVARVRAAREAAQRKMEEFGDPSEYEVTIIRGQGPKEPATPTVEENANSSEPSRTPSDDTGQHQTTVELIEGQEE
jgi:hypothetical protein